MYNHISHTLLERNGLPDPALPQDTPLRWLENPNPSGVLDWYCTNWAHPPACANVLYILSSDNAGAATDNNEKTVRMYICNIPICTE